MDATEYQLRQEISDLKRRVQELETKLENMYGDDIEEWLRRKMVEWGVIEGAAEDE